MNKDVRSLIRTNPREALRKQGIPVRTLPKAAGKTVVTYRP